MNRFATGALFVFAAVSTLGTAEAAIRKEKEALQPAQNIPAFMTRIARELGTSRETDGVGAAARATAPPAKDKLGAALADRFRQSLPEVPPMPSLAPEPSPQRVPSLPWATAGCALGAGLGAYFAGRKNWLVPILLAGLGGATASVVADQALRSRRSSQPPPLTSSRTAVR